MKELTLFEVIKYALTALVNSEVFILVILELSILILSLAFSKFINKKFVKKVAIIASIIIVIFYGLNYVDTLSIFMNNVTTKLMEFIYFPSTMEFLITMIISFVIMIITLSNRKEKTIVKVINSIVPLLISFLFLCIIEYINTMDIEFNEFSVFTEPMLMSLNELAMGVFVAWIISLVLYKIDVLIINKTNPKKIVESNVLEMNEIKVPKKQESNRLVTVNLGNLSDNSNTADELELPRLKAR